VLLYSADKGVQFSHSGSFSAAFFISGALSEIKIVSPGRLRGINLTARFVLKSTLTVPILIAGSFLGFASKPAIPSGAFPANDQSAILVGAGDIADCKDLTGAEATAKLLVQIPGTVMSATSPTRTAAKRISSVTTRPGAA
jgi:hypothetical protein